MQMISFKETEIETSQDKETKLTQELEEEIKDNIKEESEEETGDKKTNNKGVAKDPKIIFKIAMKKNNL